MFAHVMRLQRIWLSSRDKQSLLKARDYFEGREAIPSFDFKNISLFVSIPYYFIYGVFSIRMLLLYPVIASVLSRNDNRRRELRLSSTMSVKRVILANGSRLLREMLHRVINKADQLEVVQEVPNHEELPFAIERFHPAWVIVSLPYNDRANGRINDYIEDYPSVRFIFLSPDDKSVKMKWQNSYEEDLTNFSLRDFIDFLEKDLQHTSANGER
jgi:hypothetical protein